MAASVSGDEGRSVRKDLTDAAEQHGIPRTAAATDQSRAQELAGIERYQELTERVNRGVGIDGCLHRIQAHDS